MAGTEQSSLIGPNLAQAIDNTKAAAGDLNANRVIDIGDVAVIAASFGQSVSKPITAAPQAILHR